MDTDVTGQVGGAAAQVQEIARDTSPLTPKHKHKTQPVGFDQCDLQ